jgi:hypothetical protein
MPRHPPNALISLNCSHCQCSSVWDFDVPGLNNGRKTSFSRYDQWLRLGRPIMMHLPSRELRRIQQRIPDHIFSLRFLQNRRSASAPQTFYFHSECHIAETTWGDGGAERNRTADPLLAKQVLYQLSYSPRSFQESPPKMVGLGRLELPTSRLSSARSNQLSYKPEAKPTGASSCV